MSDETPEEIDQRLAPHLEYLAERTMLLFSFHFFIVEYRDDEDAEGKPDSPRAWRIQTIHNACLNTSLIALRDLNDFFAPRDGRPKNLPRAKPDDLLASDFGLDVPMTFLSEEERGWINKLIAHTTHHGASKKEFTWDVTELISKAVAQFDTFLEWVIQKYDFRYNINIAAMNKQVSMRHFSKEYIRRFDNTA